MKRYVIRYEYPGTVNGEPVGTIYARECGWVSPGSWSYRRDPHEATQFPTLEEALHVMRDKSWPLAEVVEIDGAGMEGAR